MASLITSSGSSLNFSFRIQAPDIAVPIESAAVAPTAAATFASTFGSGSAAKAAAVNTNAAAVASTANPIRIGDEPPAFILVLLPMIILRFVPGPAAARTASNTPAESPPRLQVTFDILGV